MLKAACIGATLFLFAGLANAQMPSGNVFVGFSYERTNSSAFSPDLVATTLSSPNLHGWERCCRLWGLSATSADTTAPRPLLRSRPTVQLTIMSLAMSRNIWSARDSRYRWGSSLHLPRLWSAPRTSIPAEPCPPLPIPRSPTHWAAAWIIAFSIPSLCAWKATTFEPNFSVRLRIICACRRASCFVSSRRIRIRFMQTGFSWLAESCSLGPAESKRAARCPAPTPNICGRAESIFRSSNSWRSTERASPRASVPFF